MANGQYRVSAKAITPGAQETIIAHRSDTSAVIFVNGKGIVLPSSCNGTDCKVTITGGPAGDAQELFAIHPDGISVGKLLIPSYPSLQKKVILIPVSDDVSIPEKAITQILATVYNSIGISYTLEIDNSFKNNKSWDLNQDGMLQDSKSALLSNGFTGEEKAMKKVYTQFHHIEDDAVYLFMVNEVAVEDVGLLGKMPRKSQFGFVWVKNGTDQEIGRTVAHEIGHGAYTLEHVVNSSGSAAGKDLSNYSGSSGESATSDVSGSRSGTSTENASNVASGGLTGTSTGTGSDIVSGSRSGTSIENAANAASGSLTGTSTGTGSNSVSGSRSGTSIENASSAASGGLTGTSTGTGSDIVSGSRSGTSIENSSSAASGSLTGTSTGTGSNSVSGSRSGTSTENVSSATSGSLSGSSTGNATNTPSGNLMTTGAGLALYKFQWDIVHDPGNVWGIFEDDAASELTKGLSLYKCLQKDAQSACTSPLYYAPDSTVVKLPAGATPLSVFYDDLGTTSPALPGSLNSFEYAGKEYNAIYYVSNGKFKGYSYEKYDSSSYIYAHRIQAGDKINVIDFGKELFTCAVRVNGTSYSNDGCLCQDNFFMQQYKRYMKEVIGSDQLPVQTEIAAICKTILGLPEDVLATNHELFTCYYENQELYYIDWNESPDVFTFDQLKKMHQQFKELDSSIQLLKRCEFSTGDDLVKFINAHFVIPGTKTSYLSRAPFTRLTPETRACLISKLLAGNYGQRWSSVNSGFGGQNIMLEIISNCPNSGDLYKVIKILEKDHLLYTLLSDTYDYLYVSKGNFTQLCKAITVAWLNVEKPVNNPRLISKLIIEKKWLVFDNGYLTANNQEAFRDDDQKIELEVRDGMGSYLQVVVSGVSLTVSALFAEYGKLNPFYGKFNPMDYVVLIPKRDTKAYGTTLEQGIPYILPAISVYQLFKMDTKSAIESSGALVLNTGLCAIGMEGLTGVEGLTTFGEMINVSLSNFVTYANTAPELAQDHPEFVKYTNYLALAYMVGTLTVGTAKQIRSSKIKVPAEMMEAMYVEDAMEISKRVVVLDEKELSQVQEWLSNLGNDRAYVVVHGSGENCRAIIDGVPTKLDSYSLARHLKKIGISSEKEIVLLSCGDLKTAQHLSNIMERPIIANDGWVKIFDNGVVESEHPFMRLTPEDHARIQVKVGKDLKPGKESVILGYMEDEMVGRIIRDINSRIGRLPKKDHIFKYTDEEVQLIVRKGQEIGIAEEEIEDILYNGCRVEKDIEVNVLIKQMKYWTKVKENGYPPKFKNVEEFVEFGNVIKGLIKDWNIPNDNIYLQGSALLTDNANDIDVAIKVGIAEYRTLCDRFKVFLRNPDMIETLGSTGRIPGSLIRQSSETTSRSLSSQFHERFIAHFGQDISERYKIEIHISIIQNNGFLDVSPYLKIR